MSHREYLTKPRGYKNVNSSEAGLFDPISLDDSDKMESDIISKPNNEPKKMPTDNTNCIVN